MDKILVIDGDTAVQGVLRRTFVDSGFQVTAAADGATALHILSTEVPRVVILEPRTSGRTGQDICREIRSKSSSIPIIVLSTARDEIDKILLLELGADDYVTKPFNPRELLARVRAAVRRLNQISAVSSTFRFSDVEVNLISREVSRNGSNVKLTPQEFRLLWFFVSNQGRVISGVELLHQVWENRSYPATRTIATHVLRLRQKLERDPAKPTHFLTVRRAGYKFVV
jgi:two-component system, OmpR family, alkaline phosphatase synthesis response regulator PhoP